MDTDLKIGGGDVASIELNDSAVYPGLEGHGIQTRELESWRNGDESVSTGIWECEPGRFKSNFGQRGEFIHIISGELEAIAADGTVTSVGPGDSMTFPPGWSGEWNVKSNVADRLRNMEDIAAIIDAGAPKLGKRGPCKQRKRPWACSY